jgi:hypothetical protein
MERTYRYVVVCVECGKNEREKGGRKPVKLMWRDVF